MARRRTPGDALTVLGPTEREILAVMGEGWWTVEEVRGALRGGRLAPTTVGTIMRRLADKGLLERHRRGRAQEFRRIDAADPQRAAARLAARAFLDQYGQEGFDELVDLCHEDRVHLRAGASDADGLVVARRGGRDRSGSDYAAAPSIAAMPRRQGVKRQPIEYAATGVWPDAQLDESAPAAAQYARQISLNLRAAVEHRTVAEVAEAAELARSTIYDIMSGRTWPDVVTLVKLETVLHVRLWPDLQPPLRR